MKSTRTLLSVNGLKILPHIPNNLASRLWRKDSSLWLEPDADSSPITTRLGWLDVFDEIGSQLTGVEEWVRKIVDGGQFRRTLVLGMGGSSLAPELFSKLFVPPQGYPGVEVLDSTSPNMVKRALENGVKDTLIIVASKSGTTLETMDLYRFFKEQVETVCDAAADQFVAITDAGSWLAQHAVNEGFEKVFINPSDIGGRYSALSLFGLVPAALHGINVRELLERARKFSETTTDDDPQSNEALSLGVELATRALAGQDKMVLNLPNSLEPLGAWVEQLVAESTGKEGTGILPFCISDSTNRYANKDAFNIAISDGRSSFTLHDSAQVDRAWAIAEREDIGSEFFKWEFATAIAASCLGVNPFDEPNVSEAKRSTEDFINQRNELKKFTIQDTKVFELIGIGERKKINPQLDSIASLLKPVDGGYVGILAYLPMSPEIVGALEKLQWKIVEQYQVACTVGFGPRYLHSTGQLHKGGSPVGTFLQLTSDPEFDFDVPGREYSFADLISAQADGDVAVLNAKGLPVVRVCLKGDRLEGIHTLSGALFQSISLLR